MSTDLEKASWEDEERKDAVENEKCENSSRTKEWANGSIIAKHCPVKPRSSVELGNAKESWREPWVQGIGHASRHNALPKRAHLVSTLSLTRRVFKE